MLRLVVVLGAVSLLAGACCRADKKQTTALRATQVACCYCCSALGSIPESDRFGTQTREVRSRPIGTELELAIGRAHPQPKGGQARERRWRKVAGGVSSWLGEHHSASARLDERTALFEPMLIVSRTQFEDAQTLRPLNSICRRSPKCRAAVLWSVEFGLRPIDHSASFGLSPCGPQGRVAK